MASEEAPLPVTPVGASGGALAWSADNLLAVACEHSVAIVVRPFSRGSACALATKTRIVLCRSLPAALTGRRSRSQNPADPDGPRGFTPPRRFGPPDVGAARVRHADAETGSAAALELLLDNSRGYAANRFNREAAAPRALGWGPPGAPPGRGGCALAVAYNDGRLLLYAPPRAAQHAWDEAQDLTDAAMRHREAQDWKARVRRCSFVVR